jgi:hypothetical protein
MTNMAATILAAATAAFEDGACTVKSGRAEWPGLCTGLDEIKTATEQGQVSGYSGNLRYAKASEATAIKSGDVLEVKRAIDTAFIKVRVAVRHDIGGAVRLSITAEFE